MHTHVHMSHTTIVSGDVWKNFSCHTKPANIHHELQVWTNFLVQLNEKLHDNILTGSVHVSSFCLNNNGGHGGVFTRAEMDLTSTLTCT